MPIELMYITNNTDIALLAEKCGVDRIFVDLEILGKEKRQGHLNTVISRHTMEDVSKIRKAVKKSSLLVRVDPMHDNSKTQIDEVIKRGADIIMLPMFTTREEVECFVEYVNGRAKTMLLLETPQAMTRLDDILEVGGIDEIHIGLNDLHLGMGLDFMFELISGGIIEYITNKIKGAGIKYGFGGFARIGYGLLPAERIICEHYRQGSSLAILSRSFCDAYKMSADEVEQAFTCGVAKIREYENQLKNYTEKQYLDNFLEIKKIVKHIVSIKSKAEE